METMLKLGTAKVDITPPQKVHLAGFSFREGVFAGVKSRLYARIMLFQQTSTHPSKDHAVVFISADLIWWDNKQTTILKQKMQAQMGIEPHSIILHATHNHSGPQTSDMFTQPLGKRDASYVELLESKILDGVETAFKNLEPVNVERGIGTCSIGINRRKWVDGIMTMAPNAQGPVDSDVNVIRFTTLMGCMKGILIHYACHPTTTGDSYISAEFPGAAVSYVEEQVGENVVTAYMQGCCGDIRPSLIRDNEFYRGGEEEVRALGKRLADEVLNVLETNMQKLAPCSLASQEHAVHLPFERLPSMAELQNNKQKPDIAGEWANLLLEQPERLQPSIPLHLTLVNLAEGLSLLAMNGEIVVDYALFVKEKYTGKILAIPYSNGMIGYVPTSKQLTEGGYESRDSFVYFGLPSAFDTSVEHLIQTGIIELIGKD